MKDNIYIRLKRPRMDKNISLKAPTWCSVDLRDGNQALMFNES